MPDLAIPRPPGTALARLFSSAGVVPVVDRVRLREERSEVGVERVVGGLLPAVRVEQTLSYDGHVTADPSGNIPRAGEVDLLASGFPFVGVEQVTDTFGRQPVTWHGSPRGVHRVGAGTVRSPRQPTVEHAERVDRFQRLDVGVHP